MKSIRGNICSEVQGVWAERSDCSSFSKWQNDQMVVAPCACKEAETAEEIDYSYYWIGIQENICISTADTCKNCAKCGKGFKIGTNEAYNINIKIRLGCISKIFCFCSHANMAASDKGISLKKKFKKKFLLNVTN